LQAGQDQQAGLEENVTDWQFLHLKYDIKARIDQDKRISSGLCHIAREDTAHQAISAQSHGMRSFEVIDAECVSCNLCMHVCPVENCISIIRVDDGGFQNWTTHPNSPMNRRELCLHLRLNSFG
jgi:dihydropyrimidine dehydrogenase (NAD+) subunit PreA